MNDKEKKAFVARMKKGKKDAKKNKRKKGYVFYTDSEEIAKKKNGDKAYRKKIKSILNAPKKRGQLDEAYWKKKYTQLAKEMNKRLVRRGFKN